MEDKKDNKPKNTLRFNTNKVDYTSLSPLAQELEARVFMFGACKYSRDNWKLGNVTIEDTCMGMLKSLMRHLQAYRKGEIFDPESRLPHMTHIVWNANRINDFMFHGVTHGKDGKDLFEQPLLYELPPIPTDDNLEEEFGCIPLSRKKEYEQKT